MTPDTDRAKALLTQRGATCVLVCGDDVVSSDVRGIRPLLQWVQAGRTFPGYAAADRIVGKAAALLYVSLGVASVHAGVLSAAGEAVLHAHGIACSFDVRTDRIINRNGDGICPMEATVADIDDPVAAVAALQNTVRRLQQNA